MRRRPHGPPVALRREGGSARALPRRGALEGDDRQEPGRVYLEGVASFFR